MIGNPEIKIREIINKLYETSKDYEIIRIMPSCLLNNLTATILNYPKQTKLPTPYKPKTYNHHKYRFDQVNSNFSNKAPNH
jgi:hypothetical protein